MPYVGNSPAANFASVTKDLFSGDGSTVAFTLSKAATTNGVAVFVENVRQEPTIAYAVSGTTLTFTAAPVSASGNNIYVLHHNAVASTANHPASQDLTAVKGTFTSTVDINGQELILDADADTSITADTDDRIDFKTGGTDRLQIQSTSGNNVVIADGLTLTDGNLIVASGHGIDFSATSTSGQGSMTSELLDVYEEGTFTPAAGDYSGTMTFTTAYYTKIGRVVNFAFKMTGDGTSDSSQVNITGFPYAVLQEHPVSLSYNVAGNGALQSNTTPTIPNAMVNTAEICYFYIPTGSGFTYSMIGTGYVRVSGTYMTTN